MLFPEGKDFTPKVRMRAIEYLRSKGFGVARGPCREDDVRAATATQRRDGGDGRAPEAEVVFVAHSVLEDVGTFKQLW